MRRPSDFIEGLLGRRATIILGYVLMFVMIGMIAAVIWSWKQDSVPTRLPAVPLEPVPIAPALK